MSESSVLLPQVMLDVSPLGTVLFRNNVGMATYPDGSKVRYGVCNPGGSDGIGWTSVVITQDMVGATVAVFTALETKLGKRKPTTKQANFLAAVKNAGGIAGAAYSPADAVRIVTEYSPRG